MDQQQDMPSLDKETVEWYLDETYHAAETLSYLYYSSWYTDIWTGGEKMTVFAEKIQDARNAVGEALEIIKEIAGDISGDEQT
jgi:hypothetical protein